MDGLSFGSLFDLTHTAAAEYLTNWEKPWEAVAALHEGACGRNGLGKG